MPHVPRNTYMPRYCPWDHTQEEIHYTWYPWINVQMLRPKVDPIKSEVPRQDRPPIHNKLFGPRHRYVAIDIEMDNDMTMT